MQRVLDIAQLCFYLVAMAIMVWAGHAMTSALEHLNHEMDASMIRHEAFLRDHLRQLQDHAPQQGP